MWICPVCETKNDDQNNVCQCCQQARRSELRYKPNKPNPIIFIIAGVFIAILAVIALLIFSYNPTSKQNAVPVYVSFSPQPTETISESPSEGPDETYKELPSETTHEESTALQKLISRTDIAEIYIADGVEDDVQAAALTKSGTVIGIGSDIASETASWEGIVKISVRGTHILGLKEDGTVLAAGKNTYGECDVSAWRGVTEILAGPYCSCAITESGAFLFTGYDEYSPLAWGDEADTWNGSSDWAYEFYSYYPSAPVYWVRPGSWNDLTKIVGGWDSITALRRDGEVLHFGFDNPLSEDKRIMLDEDAGWEEIDAYAENFYDLLQSDGIASLVQGHDNIVELLASGKVRVLGDGQFGQFDAEKWENIRQVFCGNGHIAGLCSDGRVVAAGRNDCGQCDVSTWRDIVFLSTGDTCTLGITSDGRILVAGQLPYKDLE